MDPQLCPLSNTEHGSSLTHLNEITVTAWCFPVCPQVPPKLTGQGLQHLRSLPDLLPKCAVQGATSRRGQPWPVQGKGNETLVRYKPRTSSNAARLSQFTWAFPHGQVGYSHQLILEPKGRTLHLPLPHLIELAWALNSVCCPCAELW